MTEKNESLFEKLLEYQQRKVAMALKACETSDSILVGLACQAAILQAAFERRTKHTTPTACLRSGKGKAMKTNKYWRNESWWSNGLNKTTKEGFKVNWFWRLNRKLKG